MAIIKLDGTTTFCNSYIDFEAYCKAKNLSEYTIKDYERIKIHFLKFMDVDDFELSQIDSNKIIEYINYCRSIGNQDVSINTKLSHLRAILNYFAKKGYCEKVEIRLLKTTTKVKQVYTKAELKLLLAKPKISKVDF